MTPYITRIYYILVSIFFSIIPMYPTYNRGLEVPPSRGTTTAGSEGPVKEFRFKGRRASGSRRVTNVHRKMLFYLAFWYIRFKGLASSRPVLSLQAAGGVSDEGITSNPKNPNVVPHWQAYYHLGRSNQNKVTAFFG